MNPFLPSGHAFVCLDSVESAVACIEFFKATAREYCNYVEHSCCGWRGRLRSKSTFTKFEDISETSLENLYRNSMLVMSRATDANEILWRNMKGNRGLFTMRRVLLFIVGLVIIIFGTTPAVIASNIDFLHVMSINELNSSIVSQYLSPLFVIMIN